REGMNVVLVAHHEASLAETASNIRALPGKSISIASDVSKLKNVEHIAESALEAFGAVHLLCNNAGVGPFGSTKETTLAEWEWILSVNLWGVIHGVHVFLPLFEEQGEGHINTTASESALYAVPYLADYNTSKFAVLGLMQSLARELHASQSKITASVLCPGAVKTKLLDDARKRPEAAQRATALSEKTNAFRGIVEQVVRDGMDPEDVATRVLAGIRDGRFWIFSHEHVPETAMKQSEEMLKTGGLIDL
ncbi:MAG: SDR family NAD(P)-dependent oxidoreductase, partial [Verrucomicrobiota bacterium]